MSLSKLIVASLFVAIGGLASIYLMKQNIFEDEDDDLRSDSESSSDSDSDESEDTSENIDWDRYRSDHDIAMDPVDNANIDNEPEQDSFQKEIYDDDDA